MAAGAAAINLAVQTAPAARDFDAEIRASLQSAKRAAGFEFLGTLTRICLVPQSGGQILPHDGHKGMVGSKGLSPYTSGH